jgi:predicted MFS family arabinose efflux permease
VFVREVLHASTAQFGVMVALFGVGGVAGWAWLQRQKGGPTLATIRLAAAAMGVILAIMSLLSTVELALIAAVPFGAAGASALVASITYVQETLSGEDRLLGLTVYHIVFRVGLSVAAIGGGLAAQAFGPARLPVLGTLQPSALVLLCAGVVMVIGATLMPTSVAHSAEAQAAAHWSGAEAPARARPGPVRDDREAAR